MGLNNPFTTFYCITIAVDGEVKLKI